MDRREFLQVASVAALQARLPRARRRGPEASELKLWYPSPASNWNEALPIGNGRFGGMIFGGVDEDEVQLNDDTLYSEEPHTGDLRLDITKEYPEVERLLRSGYYAEAGDIITKNWTGRSWPCYQPMANLMVKHQGGVSATFTKYRRELDLANAVSTTQYVRDGLTFTREYFASAADNVIVMRIKSSRPGQVSCEVRLVSPHPTATVKSSGDRGISMRGQAPGMALRRSLEWVENRKEQWKYPEIWNQDGSRKSFANTVLYGGDVNGRGMFFATRVEASAVGGAIHSADGVLSIKGATEATLVLFAATSYNGFLKSPSRDGVDPEKIANEIWSRARKWNSEQLRARHIEDYRKLFDRVSIKLGDSTDVPELPTDKRIAAFSKRDDPNLAALYLQFARYLTISGSRPGTQPLNLQGIWNDQVIPPWASGYTTNINVEMNYWPTDLLNLSECMEPLTRLIEEVSVNGRDVAHNMYKRSGWVLHHNTTLWRGAQPVDNDALPAFWNQGAGWLCQHLWDHYRFTGDREFLKRLFPVIRGAAEFHADWLVDDGAGHLVTAAGVSPENKFVYIDEHGVQKRAGVCMGPTMDIAITRELFRICVDSAKTLGIEDSFVSLVQTTLPKLLPYQVGSGERLQEWPIDFRESDPHHRHVSHLYGLYPGTQITSSTPSLREAAERTLITRGDEGTGWSRAWKICMWARLRNGEHAYKLLTNLFKLSETASAESEAGGLMPNMFCSCPPMQIDGNFGGAAGIVEMLLQSHEDAIHLLPALPQAWKDGEFRGFKARGGFEVALRWRDGRLVSAELLSSGGDKCVVVYGEKKTNVSLKAGERRMLSELL